MYKRTLITSALPYINGVKHLGNLVGSLLPADVYARYLRFKGEDVLFICGTDEHGTPAELGAAEEGKSVDVYCKEKFEIQKAIYEGFQISFDYFGRSSSSTNHATTQEIFALLDKNGFISEKTIRQVYSIDDNRFLPDRYVIGVCPKCGFYAARGDQCDKCASLLDPTDLISPRSAVSNSTRLEVRESRHLFLRLDALSDEIALWIDSHPQWSSTVLGIARKWLSEGLRERSITRDLTWGVPVNKSGYEDKVFYVWFDAPIAYISLTKEWAAKNGYPDDWTKWWKEPANVRLVQFMAKDNVPFHTIFWPAVMKATGDSWVYADEIKGFNWLTYEGGKFSTSRKRGIFTDTALSLYPADYWRYSLLALAPESNDADFSFELFALHINKDLADVLGNFVSRVRALINKHYNGVLPAGFVVDNDLVERVKTKVDNFVQEMDDLRFRAAVQALRSLWVVGNEYISEQEPWSVVKHNKEAAIQILKNCLYLQHIYSVYSSPIIPTISKQISVTPSNLVLTNCDPCTDFSWLMDEIKLKENTLFIKKISSEEVEQLRDQFLGSV
jgi:methionyl-tRNA synthetase